MQQRRTNLKFRRYRRFTAAVLVLSLGIFTGCLYSTYPEEISSGSGESVWDDENPAYRPAQEDLELAVQDLKMLLEKYTSSPGAVSGVEITTEVTQTGSLVVTAELTEAVSAASQVTYDGFYRLESALTDTGTLSSISTLITVTARGKPFTAPTDIDIEAFYSVEDAKFVNLQLLVNGENRPAAFLESLLL